MLIVNKGAVYSPQTEFCEAKANLEPLVIAAYKKSKSSCSYEEWIERKGGLYPCLWETFLGSLSAASNIPTIDWEDEKVYDIFERRSGDWFFQDMFPDFKFATEKDRVYDPIISMNPVATDCEKYMGTLADFLKEYGGMPETCILLANSCTPEQLQKIVKQKSDEAAFGWDKWDIIYI